MKCEYCGKEEANVQYHENVNGEKRELMLCSNCAKSLNLIDFPNMLSYFFSSHPKELFAEEYKKEVCNKCSYTFDDYLKQGFFGCPDCYSAFDNRIDSLLNKIHGKSRHLNVGERVAGTTVKTEKKVDSIKVDKEEVKNISKIKDTKQLKELLNRCIKEEKYEDAAKIRDRLKQLEE